MKPLLTEIKFLATPGTRLGANSVDTRKGKGFQVSKMPMQMLHFPGEGLKSSHKIDLSLPKCES